MVPALGKLNTFGNQHGALQTRGDRVRCLTIQGTDPSNNAYYESRRQAEIAEIESKWNVDIVVQPDARPSAYQNGKRQIKLAVFDMDSTLIEQEVIDELAREIGKYDEVAAITERAMRGELDFAGSLRERVALLKGLPSDIWDKVKTRITFATGARAFCAELKKQGAKMAVLSGGFTPLAEWVSAELGLDHAHANFLEQSTDEEGTTTLNGKLVEGKAIVTAERKRELLLKLAKENDVPLDQVVCVGDGSNDLKMLGEVGQAGGVAIALKAKPRVQHDVSFIVPCIHVEAKQSPQAPNKLNSRSMTDILYLLGYSQADVERVEEFVQT